MCDRDHSKDELESFEARGLVTRKQFGVMLGAGIAMMLPKVANAVTVTESEVTIKTPDGTADCYFVHPASGTAPGSSTIPCSRPLKRVRRSSISIPRYSLARTKTIVLARPRRARSASSSPVSAPWRRLSTATITRGRSRRSPTTAIALRAARPISMVRSKLPTYRPV